MPHSLVPHRKWGITRSLTHFLLLFSCTIYPLFSHASLQLIPQHLASFTKRYGPSGVQRLQHWQALMTEQASHSLTEKLQQVNGFFNQMRFVSDADAVGRNDYWLTPLEFIGRGQGDCEDFAIAKYFTLEALGVATQKMLITYVKALDYNQAHMVLTYFDKPGAVPMVLDNLTDRILPATQRTDLIPVYSFNANGLWLAKNRGQGRRVSGVDRISRWQDVLVRMQQELR